MNLITTLPEFRTQRLKHNANKLYRDHMDDDELDKLFIEGRYEKYYKRPKHLDNLTIFEFY